MNPFQTRSLQRKNTKNLELGNNKNTLNSNTCVSDAIPPRLSKIEGRNRDPIILTNLNCNNDRTVTSKKLFLERNLQKSPKERTYQSSLSPSPSSVSPLSSPNESPSHKLNFANKGSLYLRRGLKKKLTLDPTPSLSEPLPLNPLEIKKPHSQQTVETSSVHSQVKTIKRKVPPSPLKLTNNNNTINNIQSHQTTVIKNDTIIIQQQEDSDSPYKSIASPLYNNNKSSTSSPTLIVPTTNTTNNSSGGSTSPQHTIPTTDSIYQLQDLVQLGKIGSGNSGTVVKTLHVPTSKIIAKKTIPLEKNNEIILNQLIRELTIMKSVKSHKNIISFYGAYYDNVKNNEIIILMEYMDCGSLDKILLTYKRLVNRGFIDSKLKNWFNDSLILSKLSYAVLNGLDYLYTNYKIIHRDIKPSNILVNSKGQVKICDFGVSKKLINSIADTFVGTSTYMSPERIQGNVYSTKGDVWSLGLVIIELVTGKFPLSLNNNNSNHNNNNNNNNNNNKNKNNNRNSDNDNIINNNNNSPDGILDLLQRIVNEPSPKLPRDNNNYQFPTEMIDFVNKCCIKEEKNRSSIHELLAHDFILMYSDKLYNKEFKMWCKMIKSYIKQDRQFKREDIERAKFEKRQLEKSSEAAKKNRH
ncbi:mitogen-activated protein kinase kinase STE7 NDAI_0A01970 [Naumovozyma dairenensis CBS 421]|uniref:Protein kinase domain-containing protein n=1 Tax=Naumovozyma dairenensis (strain ATCC 10597 / BCRC 20456 / CBS 421 / NBRC 0211 / NRRL Y-12639) TaxID=1071378 RepID=G0W3G7_NAUDC|nr:hypothetical protein NDAI_0A01970 [Naumovozyma dairenensis CBS 421]CCD22355.1 hypothetical protein NDAI_0A01970 [Naumovozyma dairenensis CBS 421]